ncbi:MAG: hypothetical protein FWE37_03990 [Spirochaetaceae bacterium]|nr:hypothetical protein [Spirochaetaceae bacterium]
MFVENTREKTRNYLQTKGRNLDLLRFNYLLGDETGKRVLAELEKYQNSDGGFGRGLDPEMVYALSNPRSTAVAFRIMEEIKVDTNAMAFKAFNYYRNSYDDNYKGWRPLPEEEMQHENSTWLDGSMAISWAVPTVEILGGFYKYKVNFEKLEELTKLAVDYLLKAEHLSSKELLAYLYFYENVPPLVQEQLREELRRKALQNISLEVEDWEEFGDLPVIFAPSKNAFLYRDLAGHVEASLSYLLETMNDEGVWLPSWLWGDPSDEVWQRAETAHAGDLTVRYSALLLEFAFM